MCEKKIPQTYEDINNATGFAEGLLFDNEEDVLSYFLVSEMENMFGDCCFTQYELTEMAHTVIANKWHMEGGEE